MSPAKSFPEHIEQTAMRTSRTEVWRPGRKGLCKYRHRRFERLPDDPLLHD
jgi:hypothetical protein